MLCTRVTDCLPCVLLQSAARPRSSVSGLWMWFSFEWRRRGVFVIDVSCLREWPASRGGGGASVVALSSAVAYQMNGAKAGILWLGFWSMKRYGDYDEQSLLQLVVCGGKPWGSNSWFVNGRWKAVFLFPICHPVPSKQQEAKTERC